MAEKLEIVINAKDGFSATFANLERTLGSTSSRIGDFARTAEMYLVGAFTAAATAVGTYIVSSTLIAARTETLGVAMDAVAKATGTSTAVLAEQEAILKKQGITTQEARSILTLFMQSELDVADASKIARVAQDLAVISGENSSQAARTLTDAIASQEPMLLRNYGIVRNLPDIYEEYGRTLGLVTDETDANGKVSHSWARELTDVEKKQAFLNVIMAEGAKVAGVYDTAMTKAGKKLTSMPRYFEEAANAVGEYFLPAMNLGLDAVTNFLKGIPDFAAEIEKKTKGKPWGIKMQIIFEELEDAFGKWWAKNEKAAIEMGKKIGKGLIDGISATVVGAGDFISQIISPERETKYEDAGKGIGKAIMGGLFDGMKEYAKEHPIEFIITSALLGGQAGDEYGAVIGGLVAAGFVAALDKDIQDGLTANGGITWGEYWDNLKPELQLQIDGWSAILNDWSDGLIIWLNYWGDILNPSWKEVWDALAPELQLQIDGWSAILNDWAAGLETWFADSVLSPLENAAKGGWSVGTEFVKNIASGIWSAIIDFLMAPLRFLASLLDDECPPGMADWPAKQGRAVGLAWVNGIQDSISSASLNPFLGTVQAGLNISGRMPAISTAKAGSNVAPPTYTSPAPVLSGGRTTTVQINHPTFLTGSPAQARGFTREIKKYLDQEALR